jgi:hypothetical protein
VQLEPTRSEFEAKSDLAEVAVARSIEPCALVRQAVKSF